MAAPNQVRVVSYNILAQGFSSPFAYAAPHLDWAERRKRILETLVPHDGPRFAIIALQEVQSTTRGTGRLAGGEGDDDHARFFEIKLASKGYCGKYCVFDDDPRSSKASADNDRSSVGRGPWDGKVYTGAWPVSTRSVPEAGVDAGTAAHAADDPDAGSKRRRASPATDAHAQVDHGAGGRIGVSLFWDASVFSEVSSRSVCPSTHFMDLTREARRTSARGSC